SPTPVMLTRSADDWYVAGWSADGKRVFARGKNPQGGNTRYALFSVPVFGGDPVLIMPLDAPFIPYPRVSADGRALVGVGFSEGKMAVYPSSPVGSALQRYTQAPFETSASFNVPLAVFAPDNQWIALVMDAVGGRQAWKLPYPPGRAAPQRILKGLNNIGFTPRWSWFPDGRHGFLCSTDDPGVHLWFAGLHS